MKSDSGAIRLAPKQGMLTREDPLYPKKFLDILRHAPPVYIRGNTSLLHASCILAIVGSRKINSVNESSLRFILSSIAIEDLVIVSGLALGIDSVAHRIALEYDIPTIAIPGSSVDQYCIYPKSHSKLAEQIVESGGLLVSPFPPESEIRQYNFPMRNELIAAIADVVLIGSAAEKSGALITARHALNFGVELCVIPGPVTDPLFVGSHTLLQNGARLINTPADLTEALLENAHVEKKELPSDPLQQLILEILSDGRKTVEEIIAIANIELSTFSRICSELEMSGMIKKNPDGSIQKR